LVASSSVLDLAHLYFLDRSSLAKYDHSTKVISTAQDENTPWPLAFIASARHKKHLYCPPYAPLVDGIRKAITQFTNKFAHKAYFEIARTAPSEAPKIAKIPSLKMFNATLQTS
jgi:hypothetical protein